MVTDDTTTHPAFYRDAAPLASPELSDDPRSSGPLKITAGRVQKIDELLGKAGLTVSNAVELGERMVEGKDGTVAVELRDIVNRLGGIEIVTAEASARLGTLLAELRAL